MAPAFRPGSLLDRIVNGTEKRSLPLPDHVFYGGLGRPAPFKPKESLGAYGDNPWLYSGVNVIAAELARTDFKLQKRNKKGEITYIQSHQALDTMNKPQPIAGGKTMLTKMMMKLISAYHLLLNGEAFWVLQNRLRDDLGGAPQFIDLALPEFMHTVSKDGVLIKYVYRLPQREVEIDPRDVVHFRLPDPSAWERGHAPTQSIRYAIDTHKEADIMNFKRLINNAVPGGILTTNSSLSQPQIDLIRSQWRNLYGGSDNAGRFAVVPNGMDFKTVQQSHQDMQYIEGKQRNMEEILANYRVGPEMLGKTESQTRANAEAAIFVFMRFGMLPFIELFADVLTNDYLPAFPGTDGLEFGFPDPVPENMEEKRLNAENLFAGGALTPNERRKMFGMEPLKRDGMDVPYLDLAKMPVGERMVEGENTPADEL